MYVCMCVCMYVCMYLYIREIKSVIKFKHFLRTVEECTEKYLVIEETLKIPLNFSVQSCMVRNICAHKMC